MDTFDWLGLRLLIVDDNTSYANLLADTLRGKGIRHIHVAPDAGTAFETLAKNTVDIALVDYHMTPLDGAEFTRMVRTSSDSSHPELPIVIITGDSTRKTVDTVIGAGAHDFLVKPVTAATMFNRIERTLSEPRPFIRDGDFYGPKPLRPTASAAD